MYSYFLLALQGIFLNIPLLVPPDLDAKYRCSHNWIVGSQVFTLLPTVSYVLLHVFYCILLHKSHNYAWKFYRCYPNNVLSFIIAQEESEAFQSVVFSLLEYFLGYFLIISDFTFAKTSSLVTSIRYELNIVIFFHIFPLHSLTAFVFYVLDIFLNFVTITDLISMVFVYGFQSWF